MGWFADLLAAWRGRAQDKASEVATEAATRAAKASAEKALAGVAESFVGFAERELERAQAERTRRGDGAPTEDGDTPAPESEPKPEAARPPTRAEREERAREELARLKAARKS